MKKNEYYQMEKVENHHWWFIGKKLYASKLMPLVASRKKLKILDVGCGTGGMTTFLTKFGKVVGIENDSTACHLCENKNIRVIQGSANKLPIRSNTFNLITLFDVLYHKNINEDLALGEAYRVLDSHGYLMITDCALPFFWSSHDENMMAKKRYLKKELEELLIKHGFTIRFSSYMFFLTFPLFATQRLLLKIRGSTSESTVHPLPKIMNSILIQIMKAETKLLFFVGSFPIGSSILFLAQKK